MASRSPERSPFYHLLPKELRGRPAPTVGEAALLCHHLLIRCQTAASAPEALRHVAVILPASWLWSVYCVPDGQRIAEVVLKNTEDLRRAYFLDTDDLEILIFAQTWA